MSLPKIIITPPNCIPGGGGRDPKGRALRFRNWYDIGSSPLLNIVTTQIIIIMAGMAVFYVAGYLIEERRRWPVITASPRGQCSK